MKANPTKQPPKATPKTPTPKAAKTPQATAPQAVPTPPPAPDPLAGVTIRADALTYAADDHRPRIQIKTPAVSYYKLVPGVRTATKAEALTAAQAYREQILASGELPPKGERQPKATPITAQAPATPPRPDRFGWSDGDITLTPPPA